MAFSANVLSMMRVVISPDKGGVYLATDRFGSMEALSGIPPGGGNQGVISATWLANEEIEVIIGDLQTEEGEIRHYTGLNEYYNAGYTN